MTRFALINLRAYFYTIFITINFISILTIESLYFSQQVLYELDGKKSCYQL